MSTNRLTPQRKLKLILNAVVKLNEETNGGHERIIQAIHDTMDERTNP